MRAKLALAVALLFFLVPIPPAQAAGGPGTPWSDSPDASNLPEGCANSFNDGCYHMRGELNALDSPKIDVLLLVPPSTMAERDLRAMHQVVDMYDAGIEYVADTEGWTWLADGVEFHVTPMVFDPVNGNGGEFSTYPLIDPEIVVFRGNPFAVPLLPVGSVLLGIGIDPMAPNQGPCHGVQNPFDIEEWQAVPGFNSHHDGRSGTYVEDCDGAGGNVCFAINGGLELTPDINLIPFDSFDLIAHEVGHCLRLGHVGDAGDHTTAATPFADIMSYTMQDHRKCVSSLDVEMFAVAMSPYLDVNGDGQVLANDRLYHNDHLGDGTPFQVQHPGDHYYASNTGEAADCPQADLGLAPLGEPVEFYPDGSGARTLEITSPEDGSDIDPTLPLTVSGQYDCGAFCPPPPTSPLTGSTNVYQAGFVNPFVLAPEQTTVVAGTFVDLSGRFIKTTDATNYPIGTSNPARVTLYNGAGDAVLVLSAANLVADCATPCTSDPDPDDFAVNVQWDIDPLFPAGDYQLAVEVGNLGPGGNEWWGIPSIPLRVVGAGVGGSPAQASSASASGPLGPLVGPPVQPPGPLTGLEEQAQGFEVAAAGDPVVTLSVSDDNVPAGSAVTFSVNANHQSSDNGAPTAAFGFTADFLEVAFDGSASSDPDGDALSFAWDFGDGGSASTETASHTFAAAGTYDVTLTVDDGNGGTDAVTHSVTVSAEPSDPVVILDETDPTLDGFNPGADISRVVVTIGAGEESMTVQTTFAPTVGSQVWNQMRSQGVIVMRWVFDGVEFEAYTDGTVWDYNIGDYAVGMSYFQGGNTNILTVTSESPVLGAVLESDVAMHVVAYDGFTPLFGVLDDDYAPDFGSDYVLSKGTLPDLAQHASTGGPGGDETVEVLIDGAVVHTESFSRADEGTTGYAFDYVHTFASAGTYEVEVLFTDDLGATASDGPETVTVTEGAPHTPNTIEVTLGGHTGTTALPVSGGAWTLDLTDLEDLAQGDHVLTAKAYGAAGTEIASDSITVHVTTDGDGDGVADADDNCPSAANADQADLDGDGIGDACDSDSDGDGVADADDNCPTVANASQANLDGDADGDACDSDRDGDGVANGSDAFPDDPTETADTDGDGVGDNADACPGFDDAADQDGDGTPDGCDGDLDGDGYSNNQEIAQGTDPSDATSFPDNKWTIVECASWHSKHPGRSGPEECRVQ